MGRMYIYGLAAILTAGAMTAKAGRGTCMPCQLAVTTYMLMIIW